MNKSKTSGVTVTNDGVAAELATTATHNAINAASTMDPEKDAPVLPRTASRDNPVLKGLWRALEIRAGKI